MDGRALSILSASQQVQVAILGFSGNLPDALNSFLVQNGNPMGSVSGSNTRTLTQANLPDINFPVSSSHKHRTFEWSGVNATQGP